jgi:hypothetical protein
VYSIFEEINSVLDYAYVSPDHAKKRELGYVSPEKARAIETLDAIIDRLSEFVGEHFNSEYRVRTVASRLLWHFERLIRLICPVFSLLAEGRSDEAKEAFELCRYEMGEYECEIERYFDHFQFFNSLSRIFSVASRKQIPFYI